MFRCNYTRYSSFDECRVKKYTPTMHGLASNTFLIAEDVSFEDKILNYLACEHGFGDILISLKRGVAKNLLDHIYLRSNKYIYTYTNNVARLVPKPLHYISKANCKKHRMFS